MSIDIATAFCYFSFTRVQKLPEQCFRSSCISPPMVLPNRFLLGRSLRHKSGISQANVLWSFEIHLNGSDRGIVQELQMMVPLG
jgi:hypothetical protein